MRTIHWLFVVSMTLFIAGIGFVIAGARSMQQGTDREIEGPQIVPVASVKQIMNGIVRPASTVVYGAVSTIVSARGVQETAPENDEEWAAVADGAAALVEAGNLLLMPGRAVDNGDWIKISQAMIDGSTVALKAAEAKDKDGVLDSGGAINTTCDNCHAKYRRE